jgi:hypothetical protein
MAIRLNPISLYSHERAWTRRMSNLQAQEDFRRALKVQARIIGFPLVALGLLSVLSGALGLDFWNRFFTGGALGLNDLVPGVVLLGIGLVLLRVSGGAPLTE